MIKGLEHLQTYPCVQDALASGQIHIHGLMFGMKDQVLKKYYPEDKEFRVIAGGTEARANASFHAGEFEVTYPVSELDILS